MSLAIFPSHLSSLYNPRKLKYLLHMFQELLPHYIAPDNSNVSCRFCKPSLHIIWPQKPQKSLTDCPSPLLHIIWPQKTQLSLPDFPSHLCTLYYPRNLKCLLQIFQILFPHYIALENTSVSSRHSKHSFFIILPQKPQLSLLDFLTLPTSLYYPRNLKSLFRIFQALLLHYIAQEKSTVSSRFSMTSFLIILLQKPQMSLAHFPSTLS